MTRSKTAVFGMTVLALLVFASLAAGFASGSPDSTAASVGTGSTGLGRAIVDSRGHTLYLFEKDKRGASACAGVCAVYWPPFVTKGAPSAVKGARHSLLGTVSRADGTRQVTYAGHPLYFFSGDTKRGQTNGEGLKDFGAAWYALMPSGQKIDRD